MGFYNKTPTNLSDAADQHANVSGIHKPLLPSRVCNRFSNLQKKKKKKKPLGIMTCPVRVGSNLLLQQP